MAYQSEAQLESQLIEHLSTQGYSKVAITDEQALEDNFKVQFEAFNRQKLLKPLTGKEWERVFNHLKGKSIFQSAKTLRDKFVLERDDGTKVYLRFFNEEDPTKTSFRLLTKPPSSGSIRIVTMLRFL